MSDEHNDKPPDCQKARQNQSERAAREARLADNLRANLRRRKAASRKG